MLSYVKDLDIILSAVVIGDLWKVATSQWHSEQYNIAIISGLFTQTSNIWRIMNMFESIIWGLIIISILTITLYSTLYRIHQDKIISNEEGK